MRMTVHAPMLLAALAVMAGCASLEPPSTPVVGRAVAIPCPPPATPPGLRPPPPSNFQQRLRVLSET